MTASIGLFRLFSDVDRVERGMDGGLPCFPLFLNEGERRVDIPDVFTAHLGGIVVAVDKAQFQAFLQRNPILDRGPSPKPEEILSKLWRDRASPPLFFTSSQRQELFSSLSSKGISSQHIEQILFGFESRWYGFYEKSQGNPTLLQQTHGIKGLKIFYNREGKLVADIAIGIVGEGAFKTIKRKYTLFPEGILEENIRYKAREEDFEGRVFFQDISQEIRARKLLGSIPHLLDIYVSGQYKNKRGDIRIRYEAKLCHGSAENLVFSENGEPLPSARRQPLRALGLAYDALSALVAMHKKGCIHNDVKLANILCGDGDEGLLSDLSFISFSEEPYVNRGTGEYCGPERIWPELEHNIPESDIFAFGLVLLFICCPNLREDFDELQRGCLNVYGAIPLSEVTYKKYLEQFRGCLRTCTLGNFIADLLHPDYKQRPTSEQVLARFTEIRPFWTTDLEMLPTSLVPVATC